jgi:hypothetical protein
MIERCARAVPGSESRRPFKQITFCPEASADVGCRGFSDGCLYRDKFRAASGRPKETVTFILPLSEHEADPVLEFTTSLTLANKMQFPS